jgi:hypothetical protein
MFSLRRGLVPLLAVLIGLMLPASAPLSVSAADLHLCESFGNQFCAGSTDLELFTAVTERNPPGRVIVADRQGSETFDNHPVYLLRFNADTSKCIASADDHFVVVIHACNGGNGVKWAREKSDSNHDLWINREASVALNETVYLTGANDGSQFILDRRGAASGDLQQFDLVP